MATLLFLGPTKPDGDRDTYLVNEEIEDIVAAVNSDARFVSFTDTGDGADVWFRVDAIRFFYAN